MSASTTSRCSTGRCWRSCQARVVRSRGPSVDATARATADQAYLREVTEDTLHADLRRQPRTLYHLATLTAGALAVDDDWSSFGLARFVVSLRNLRSGDISFVVASRESVRNAA